MKKIYLVPREGLKVPDPEAKDHLPPEGREVPDSPYWRRRLRGKEVTLEPAKAAEPEPPAAPEPAAEEYLFTDETPAEDSPKPKAKAKTKAKPKADSDEEPDQ